MNGVITQGVGGGKDYLNAEGISREIQDKIGFKPYPGTLNVKLTRESVRKITSIRSIENKPKVGVFPGILLAGSIGPYDCAVIRPQDPNYPRDIVEVIAPLSLRKELNLGDGDEVAIKVHNT